ncbi:glutathione synthase [Malassezia cuniculi]|uniref:Glutathione synthetase n=1 Tax=Malassezia cuniculi TaxID=948313 RepID=A0AAF0EQZ0_9BASI|nr:glutathione synthase [Malassezia cuniculi]
MPEWPPEEVLEDRRLVALVNAARDYALAHGLVIRAPAKDGAQPPQDTVIHAPLTLLPTPFPRNLFENAKRLQPLYNKLYSRVASDHDFIREVIGGAVARVDDFQRRLYEIFERVLEEGVVQPVTLGLFRSDYLMHTCAGATDGVVLKQVEFNTISSSFGPLCAEVTKMHRYLLARGAYDATSHLLSNGNIPENNALATLAAGLADAHRYYVQNTRGNGTAVQGACVLFVVQPNERNTFDQRAIEYELLAKHGIRSQRASMEDLSKWASLQGNKRILVVQSPLSTLPIEISTVYFRAGYDPVDYQNDTAWETRFLLERSLAIKCPSVSLQLAGAKKVQQVLAEPGVLERFITHSEAVQLRPSFAELLPVNEETIKIATASPEDYVLKPQREGGGHNIYKQDIPPALAAMAERDAERAKEGAGEVHEHEGYILMGLIKTPPHRGNVFLRANTGPDTPGGAAHATETVSELGIYGTSLFGPDLLVEKSDGFLLRTKGSDSNEGGVAVGYSVIDTPLLV